MRWKRFISDSTSSILVDVLIYWASSYFSSSFPSSFSEASLLTDAYISFAFSSLGTNGETGNEFARDPHSFLNSSLLGDLEGISILKTFALRHAIAEIN
jgi:hypothetical protein